MTDKEYRTEKTRVEKYIKKWHKTIGLGWFRVNMEWSREHDGEVAARTNSSWQYKSATITWFLPHLASQSDEMVEVTVVHEFVHILLSGIAQNIVDDGSGLSDQINEYTTVLVTAAIMWSRDAGNADKNETPRQSKATN